MKRLTETYKLYRELPMFQALYDSLEELGETGEIPLELVPGVVHEYDKVVCDLVQQSQEHYYFTGNLLTFRIVPDMQWLVFNNVTIYKVSPKRNYNTKKRGRKAKTFTKNIVCKVDKMKLWCHDTINDETLTVSDTSTSPYTIEVDKKTRERKKKLKLTDSRSTPSKSTNTSTFDPLMHVRTLSRNKRVEETSNCLAPMPYNEKLRRGGPANSMLIAESQLSKIDVLKGRYRKQAREYPYICVEDIVKKTRHDVQIVKGVNIPKRTYLTLFRSQDRHIAEMATRAGGTLNLTAHNIHTVPIKKTKKHLRRDTYTTRRREKIQLASFDCTKSYSLLNIPKSSAKKDDTNSGTETSSESHDNVTTDERKDVTSDADESNHDVDDRGPNNDLLLKCKKEYEDEAFVNNLVREASEKSDLENLLERLGCNGEEGYTVKEEPWSSRNSSLERRIVKKKLKEDFDNFNMGQDYDLPLDMEI